MKRYGLRHCGKGNENFSNEENQPRWAKCHCNGDWWLGEKMMWLIPGCSIYNIMSCILSVQTNNTRHYHWPMCLSLKILFLFLAVGRAGRLACKQFVGIKRHLWKLIQFCTSIPIIWASCIWSQAIKLKRHGVYSSSSILSKGSDMCVVSKNWKKRKEAVISPCVYYPALQWRMAEASI